MNSITLETLKVAIAEKCESPVQLLEDFDVVVIDPNLGNLLMNTV